MRYLTSALFANNVAGRTCWNRDLSGDPEAHGALKNIMNLVFKGIHFDMLSAKRLEEYFRTEVKHEK